MFTSAKWQKNAKNASNEASSTQSAVGYPMCSKSPKRDVLGIGQTRTRYQQPGVGLEATVQESMATPRR